MTPKSARIIPNPSKVVQRSMSLASMLWIPVGVPTAVASPKRFSQRRVNSRLDKIQSLPSGRESKRATTHESTTFLYDQTPHWWTPTAPAFTAACLSLLLAFPQPSAAVLKSPNASIPRTVDAALRRSIPAFNANVEALQDTLEQVQFKLRIPQRKPWAAMSADVDTLIQKVADKDKLLDGVLDRDQESAQSLISGISEELQRLQAAIASKDPDRTSIRAANALERVAQLELLQAPGLTYRIPSEYASLPRLTGRAVVELVIQKAGSSETAFVSNNSEDGPQRQGIIRMTVDGYSAPLTAGNFIKNVVNGSYEGIRLAVDQVSIVIGNNNNNNNNSNGNSRLPLEILPMGDFEPLYRLPLDVRSGELPVLPLSINGSIAMARSSDQANSIGYVSKDQFFIHKFDKQQSGLAGLAFDEGEFGVFGYITEGRELLSSIEDGDVLVRAKVIDGLDKLQVPNE